MPQIFHLDGEYHFRPDTESPKRVSVIHGEVTHEDKKITVEEYDAPTTIVGRDAKVVIEDIPKPGSAGDSKEEPKPKKFQKKPRSVKKSGES